MYLHTCSRMMWANSQVAPPYSVAAISAAPEMAAQLKVNMCVTSARMGLNQPAKVMPVQAHTKKISRYLVNLMRILRKPHDSLSSFKRLLRSPSTKWSIHNMISVYTVCGQA